MLQENTLVRNTGWMVLGQGANFFVQAGYFLLVAKLLGVTQYGVFAGAYALVSTVSPYSTLGSAMLFMRYAGADRNSAPLYWGNALATTICSSVVIGAILMPVGCQLLGMQSVALILVLVASNCCMSQIVSSASVVFQTFEILKATAGLQALSNLLRLIAVGILVLTLHHASAFQCALGILASSMLAALTAVICVKGHIGGMHTNGKLFRLRFWEGLGFSFAGSTQTAYNDLDKLMLSHYGMNAANGIYTMAYRIVDFSTTPVTAMDSAILPRYFALHQNGSGEVKRLARKGIPLAALVGLGAACCTLVASPFVVAIVGHSFAEALHAVRWLCWLPALRGIHQLSGGVLTATGNQNYRTAAQFTVAVLNLVLNILWIPAHGWLGAAWATLISDGSLCVLNLGLMFLMGLPQRENPDVGGQKELAP
jgi:O-antigen/teichoic acid export membrane protein